MDSLYCGKWRKISKSCRDLELDQTVPNVELIRNIFICYNLFEFQVPRLIFLSYRAYRHTDRHTHTQTHADEYSIMINRNYITETIRKLLLHVMKMSVEMSLTKVVLINKPFFE